MKRVISALFLSLAVATSAWAGQQQPKSQLQTKRSNTPATTAAPTVPAKTNPALSKDKKTVAKDEDERDGADTSDTFITEMVKKRLATKAELKDAPINVSVRNHIVTLSGQVKEARHAHLAMRTARTVKGVRNVENKLEAPGGKSTTMKVIDVKGARKALEAKQQQK